jgi:nucleotide-binding universal stress UspA family protein
MKILATFDATEFSRSTVPLLVRLSALPGAEITLMSVVHEPDGTLMRRGARRPVTSVAYFDRNPMLVIPNAQPQTAETREQAVERVLATVEENLAGLARDLPPERTHVEAHISDSASKAIIECARREAVDVIVMATHSRTGLARAVLGSTTDAVIRSGVAPVLVVHPKEAK